MKTAFKFIGWALVASLVASVLLIALGAAVFSPLEHATIHIDDESFTLGALRGSDWLVATGGMLVATLAMVLAVLLVVLVVPVTVIVPLLAVALALLAVVAVVALGLAVTAGVAAGVAALALSPLLLLGWAVWRLARPKPAPSRLGRLDPRVAS